MEDVIAMDSVISTPDDYIQPVPKIETGFLEKLGELIPQQQKHLFAC